MSATHSVRPVVCPFGVRHASRVYAERSDHEMQLMEGCLIASAKTPSQGWIFDPQLSAWEHEHAEQAREGLDSEKKFSGKQICPLRVDVSFLINIWRVEITQDKTMSIAGVPLYAGQQHWYECIEV
ncbi:unnamed protein product [Echinostoma caproni]|uniref:Integron gene cassette protein n=1 Tax=Echinostoma caproni TaxID=27848 RepID=A0A183B3L6_9TREM|nr:unnamed protein product [Echinostoma caproni]